MGDEASLMGMDGILDDLEWKRAADIFRFLFPLFLSFFSHFRFLLCVDLPFG